jgi:hypothetical protein
MLVLKEMQQSPKEVFYLMSDLADAFAVIRCHSLISD